MANGLPFPTDAEDIPAPAIGQAPLAGRALGAPTGGQPFPSALDVYRQQLQREAQVEQGPIYRAFAGLAGKPVQAQQQLAELEVAQQKMQMDTLKEGMAALMKFADLDPQTQAALAPAFTPFMQRSFKTAGVDLPPDLFAALASQPGVAKTALDIFFQDKAFSAAEKDAYLPALRKLKGPQVQEYLTKVQSDKVASIVPQVNTQMPQIVAGIRVDRKLAPGTPVPIEDIMRSFEADAGYKGSGIIQRAVNESLYGTGSEGRRKAWGIGEEAGAEVMAKWTWEQHLGTGGVEAHFLKDPYVIESIKDTTKALGRNPTPTEAITRMNPEKMAIALSRARHQLSLEPARARVEVEMGRPLTAKELNDYATIRGLERGEIQAPPSGTTVGGALQIAVDVKDSEKKAFAALKKAENVLGVLERMSAPLITARNAVDAQKQRGSLWWAEKFNTDPRASAYGDAREGFLGPLARSVSEEVGVLTEGDTHRIRRMLTGWDDTIQSRELKMAAIREIIGLNRTAILEQIRGGALPEHREELRSRVDTLLKRAETASADIRREGLLPGHIIIVKGGQTQQIPSDKRAEAVRKGWTVVED